MKKDYISEDVVEEYVEKLKQEGNNSRAPLRHRHFLGGFLSFKDRGVWATPCSFVFMQSFEQSRQWH